MLASIELQWEPHIVPLIATIASFVAIAASVEDWMARRPWMEDANGMQLTSATACIL